MSDKYQVYDIGYGCRVPMKKPFIVPTPRAYIIDLATFPDEEEAKTDLLRDVEFLRVILNLLGISEGDAYRSGYTLNKYTGQRLEHLAHMQGKITALKLIQGHNW